MTSLGEQVDIKGFQKFCGNLNSINQNTRAVYKSFLGYEIIFQISTMLPDFQSDPTQLDRKGFIQSNRVVIVFLDGSKPFDPNILNFDKTSNNIKKKIFFPLVFKNYFAILLVVYIVITPKKSISEKKIKYRVAVVAKPKIPPFSPLIPSSSFVLSPQFSEWLLTKCNFY